ncbi:diguanylate cyclase/phosphodiesterase (GGDEF & EAL domains) with PAS/PAC sensor(s) [hydrothermal vent metagenome]|uniref:Diguanylate cyclase/phosphodiesterase (GGDEF & EAL domains) with PAS/PAC sensor(S) n=1 Tax=hydrothermal vent metagenome TaxID=652676 RepID=A0A1W1CLG7_9ZZZZ
MLLPETKEREYRFKLALRIGLPIFALILAFISHTLITNYHNLHSSFFIEAVLVILVSIYFIFYLIYHGFSIKITDDVTKTFTREYLYNYLQKEIKDKREYTLVLISIDNLNDINTLYGIKNGDKILYEIAIWIAGYFEKEGIKNFPMGHIKGGDFILGLEGYKTKYITVLELMALKFSELKIDDIEVKISTAITDTTYSYELDYLIENLFESIEKQKNSNQKEQEEDISPNELESIVIHAIENRKLIIMAQNVYFEEEEVFHECFVKLKAAEGKVIYPKTYLKVINKLGLVIDFDLVVLERVLENCKGKDKIFALNISPTSLRNEKFLSRAKELLRENKTKVMFILFEAEYYSHTSRYNSVINSLKEYGVRFVIDRAASIHTSFLYLRELNIDVIRFDTYYSNEEKLEKNRSIIEGFNLMAHEKGIKSWMKNIEDQKTYALAKEIGIDYLQGKYLANLEEIGEK